MNKGKNRLTNKTRLLIYEYKERYPVLCAEDIADMFNLSKVYVEHMFKKGELIFPSKMKS